MFFGKSKWILPGGVLGILLVASGLPMPAHAGNCTSNAQCDDGLFCNGRETCQPDDPRADIKGCIPGDEPPGANGRFSGPRVDGICRRDDNPFTRDYCDEERDLCRHEQEDIDGDGHSSIRSGGDDCNDEDAQMFPGNVEICDPDGRNEDCNPTTVGRKDSDGDGYTDSSCFNTGADGRRIYDTRRH